MCLKTLIYSISMHKVLSTTLMHVHILSALQVNSAAFSHNHGNKLGSNYFVTVHHRRVQYWYYGTANKDTKVGTVCT